MNHLDLTNEDREYLKSKGCKWYEINQIERAAHCSTYELYDSEGMTKQRISAKKAIEMFGRHAWLNGLSRSAFHWSATIGDSNPFLGIDSSKIFK